MDPDTADPYSTIIKFIILALFIIMSALFSSAETAFISSDKFTIRQLIQEGNKRAKKVNKILENKDAMLSAILIGNNVVNLSASSLTTTLVYELYGNAFVSIATGILTLVVLICGEIVPKTLAGKYPEKIAMAYAPILHILIKVLTPVIFILNFIISIIMKILRIKADPMDTVVTEDVVKTMLDMSLEDGQIEKEEHEIINDVLELNDSCAKDIMIPRTHVVSIRETATYDDIVKVYQEEKYSRLVVLNEKQNEVLGIINIKDMLFLNKETFKLQDILRKPYVTYESKKISDLLKELRKGQNNMAVILDEYGDLVGIITIEDILEEIVGQIRDEYDADELKQIKKIDENIYEIEGSLNIDDVNEALSINLESEEYNSIGGYIIEKLELFPKAGDKYEQEGIYLEVLEVVNNRIEKVKLEIKPQVENTEQPED
jgi:CBS domain containing-hemolysin-like protein